MSKTIRQVLVLEGCCTEAEFQERIDYYFDGDWTPLQVAISETGSGGKYSRTAVIIYERPAPEQEEEK